MLGNTNWAHDNMSGTEGLGWSSAYSPYSVLLALLAMNGELLPNHNGVSPATAAQAAKSFGCKCGHNARNELPCIADAANNPRVEVFVPPKVVLLVPREALPAKALPAKQVAAAAAQTAAIVVVKSAAPSVAVAVAKNAAIVSKVEKVTVRPKGYDVSVAKGEIVDATAVKKAKKDDWVVVGAKKQDQRVKTTSSSVVKPKILPLSVKAQPVAEADFVPVGWIDEALEKKKWEKEKQRLRKKAKRQALAEEQRRLEEAKREKQAEKKARKKKSIAAQTVVAATSVAALVSDGKSTSSAVVVANRKMSSVKTTVMGAFAKMPADVLAYLLRFLPVHDILRCELVCRGFERVAKNTFLWKDLYAREFPLSSVKQMGDFRQAYTLRVQGLVSELCCFHTKVAVDEDADVVLGFGINFTRNPKTGRLDYLDVASELMSSDAFYLHKMRKGPKGEEIKAFLPLYLTAEHFQRARVAPLLKRIQKVCLVWLCFVFVAFSKFTFFLKKGTLS
jgi:hypothetical protein